MKPNMSEGNYFEDFTGLPLKEWVSGPKSKRHRSKRQLKHPCKRTYIDAALDKAAFAKTEALKNDIKKVW